MLFVDYLCINPLNMTYNKEHFTELCNYHIHTHLFKITAFPLPFFWYTPIRENILEFSPNTFKLLAYFVYVGFILVNAPSSRYSYGGEWGTFFKWKMVLSIQVPYENQMFTFVHVVTLIKRYLIHERSRLISIK